VLTVRDPVKAPERVATASGLHVVVD